MISIDGVSHIGIRVSNPARSEAFYALFGFEPTFRGGAEPVVVMKNSAGVEINLICNGTEGSEPVNVLMDVPEKHPGYTHVALAVRSIDGTVAELGRLGIAISGGPMKLGDGVSLFVRDPDRNVIELRVMG
jgi:lactoylglutathione lyase